MSGRAFRATKKQREIMEIICREVAAGWRISSRDLQTKLPYGSDISHQSVLCSIKFLVKHELLVKDREHRALYLNPTERGMALYGPKPHPD